MDKLKSIQIKYRSIQFAIHSLHTCTGYRKKEKIWQLLTIHFSSVATFLFVCTEKSSRKCETNPCKFRDCAGPRKRSPRPWKTDDALALAPPEGKRDKMQFVKKGSARRCLYTLFVGALFSTALHQFALFCLHSTVAPLLCTAPQEKEQSGVAENRHRSAASCLLPPPSIDTGGPPLVLFILGLHLVQIGM